MSMVRIVYGTKSPAFDNSSFIALETVENRAKTGKNTANFCENRKNHGKDTASNHGPEDHYTVYKTHLALTGCW